MKLSQDRYVESVHASGCAEESTPSPGRCLCAADRGRSACVAGGHHPSAGVGIATLYRHFPQRSALVTAVALDRLPLHVRSRLGRRVPELLIGRRRLRRDASPPPEPRRRVHGDFSRATGEAARLSRPDGWSFPWVSSGRSDFNHDFHVTIDPSVAPVEYNYRNQAELEQAMLTWREWSGEQPG